ncbi:hypothetical protein [Methylorubrum aminovorans]|jgi:hypothetical protein|uniref:hypothetical protein n=1 Tax=Methylorubrum aminovorans TaxID=269069 RepID=UPI003C2EC137
MRSNLEDPIDTDPLDEGWIVAHDEKRTVEAAQSAFQDFDRLDVEMVGRFIKDDEPGRRRPCKGRRQACPQTLAAGQRADDALGIPVAEGEPSTERVGFLVAGIGMQAADVVENAAFWIKELCGDLGDAVGQAAR